MHAFDQRQVSSRPACSTEQVSGQTSELHKKEMYTNEWAVKRKELVGAKCCGFSQALG